ncbi:Arylsulfatase (plasmid) [Neorhizobium galegae bv. officinalis bv. officinalis str. HAMBI 1141]|uniref:Arylsulfatase n=2 Tax=Neorhizobium galegae TaxID=399 RepID=A0A068THI0_NEOGA|nr:Arylsulfatase [Neorhizobium galegae bv. officinalis bv. officinalis str. HAMBI 1141]
MKAIMIMFDTLNRRFLPAYGADWNHLPNFRRLQERTVTFDNCYGGSMPCMPARRELHTGRYNFLHRSWGPLEPFDDSMPEMLRTSGVYTHLVTDHQHYWEDGGATYHNRYSSYEFCRGQEGDRWKGHVGEPLIPATASWRSGSLWRQDWVNRQYMTDIADHPQTKTFDAGVEFIKANHAEDRWFLQVECFDPHEPFFSYDRHKERYPHDYDGPHFDWPDYRAVTEKPGEVEHARMEYAALLSMCDDSLGRVLDAMDEYGLWDDTMLIVCTDHGLLLGERGWWGKNVQPWYEENIHTPLFVWDPRLHVKDERRSSLVQTIDFGPTLLDFFGVTPTEDMQGRPLSGVISTDEQVREAGLFGSHGGHVCITDGRYVYMRACVTPENQPLEQYTLMPTHMDHRFAPGELKDISLAGPFPFTKQVQVMRLPAKALGNPYIFGTLLFDLQTDPEQQKPLRDEEVETRMANLLVAAMRANHTPASQFERLGLPLVGAVGPEHLLIDRQWAQVKNGERLSQRNDDSSSYHRCVRLTLNEVVKDARLSAAFRTIFGLDLSSTVLDRFGHLTPWQLSFLMPNVTSDMLRVFDAIPAEWSSAGALP